MPKLIRSIKKEGLNVIWSCDPMHGNTYKTNTGFKTRHFDTILEEIEHFFAIHRAEGTIPGGVHFELTFRQAKKMPVEILVFSFVGCSGFPLKSSSPVCFSPLETGRRKKKLGKKFP